MVHGARGQLKLCVCHSGLGLPGGGRQLNFHATWLVRIVSNLTPRVLESYEGSVAGSTVVLALECWLLAGLAVFSFEVLEGVVCGCGDM